MPTKRCKYCGGTGWKVMTGKAGQIIKEACIYCKNRGYIFTKIEKKEVIKNAVLE